MSNNPIYIIHEYYTDSWNNNYLRDRMLTDSGYFLSLNEALAKASEFVSKAYKKYVGCSLKTPLRFLDYLSEKNIPTVLRQVIIPTLNDNKENILRLKKIRDTHKNIYKTEFLPFKKICSMKYENLRLDFKFKDIPEPTKEQIDNIEKIYME